MDKTEQAWKDYLKGYVRSEDSPTYRLMYRGISDYKQALREDINLRIRLESSSYKASVYKDVLQLIDSVTPTK